MSIDLMKRRVKVTNPYPDMKYPVGTIIELDRETAYITKPDGETDMTGSYFITNVLKVEDYPQLFRPLAWWEEREETDMPKYVKTKAGNSVRKVFSIKGDYVSFTEQKYRNCKHWLPATEEEYEHYIKQKQK